MSFASTWASKIFLLTRVQHLGSGAFFGLAGYSYFSGMSQLQKQQAQILQSKSIFGMRSRKAGIASISFGLAWMGLWRLMN
jgi:hypothetical protein